MSQTKNLPSIRNGESPPQQMATIPLTELARLLGRLAALEVKEAAVFTRQESTTSSTNRERVENG